MKLLILDEPTASLSEKDSEALLNLLLEFKQQGIASILISHKLNEVSKVADRITILRDGQTIETLEQGPDQRGPDHHARWSAARSKTAFRRASPQIGEKILEVKNWSVYHPIHSDRQVIKGVDLDLRKGEVVGIAGLMGSGRTEFAMSLFGRSYGKRITGEVFLNGKKIDTSTVGRAVEHGLAYVTEDRKTLRAQPHRPHQAQHHAGQPQGGVEPRA